MWGDTLQGVTVMSVKRSSVFQEKGEHGVTDTAERRLTKKKVAKFFRNKIRGVIPSVAAPGVTHPSDATEPTLQNSPQ